MKESGRTSFGLYAGASESVRIPLQHCGTLEGSIFPWLFSRSVGRHTGDSSDVTLAFEDAQFIPLFSREETVNTDDTDDTDDTDNTECTKSTESTEST